MTGGRHRWIAGILLSALVLPVALDADVWPYTSLQLFSKVRTNELPSYHLLGDGRPVRSVDGVPRLGSTVKSIGEEEDAAVCERLRGRVHARRLSGETVYRDIATDRFIRREERWSCDPTGFRVVEHDD
ncbi:hypothetical protein DSM112329_01066 [Paraconexibacter sp. AEG42_29]|uniref:Uncharacterized protein n=1 Tax=Paraconexibacter sp. AEG42_29 TaxID=2997339 RepID=A0AAU7ARH5_9ACTN